MTSWWIQSAPALSASERPLADAEVLVLGGGVAGVSTALHLAQMGVDALLLEQGEIACRASGRNDGQLLLGLGEHYNRITGQFGPDRGRLLWDFLACNHRDTTACLQQRGIECGLVQQGGLRLSETAHEQSELEAAALQLREIGAEHELLSPKDVAVRFPAGRGYHGALRLPGEAILQPARMVRGLAEAARSSGARIHERCGVRRIEGQAGEFVATLADGREVRAGAVVLCTSALAPELDPTGFLRRTVFPFRGQVIATEPLSAAALAGFPRCAMSSNFCYEYFRVHEDRLFLGGMRWSVAGEELGITDDSAANAEVSANLRAYAARHFAGGEDLRFPHCWTGIMAGTPDGLPLLGGIPGAPGLFTLSAFNGYGLSFAFRAGKCLAEILVDGKASDPAAAMFSPRRFAS